MFPFAVPKLTPFMWKTMGVVLLVISAVLFYSHWRSSLIEEGRKLGKAEVQALWDAEKLEQANADLLALNARIAENQLLRDVQFAINQDIERTKNEELRKVRADLYAERMRRPKALCAGSATGQAETTGDGSSDAADPRGGLLSESLERDIRALIWQSEEVAATARACQKFVRDNGMYTPPPRTETVEPKDPNPDADGGDHGNLKEAGAETHAYETENQSH